MADPLWTPVVYGRTAGADVWWRVRPPDVDRGWLDATVHAVAAAGAGLQDGPRFLLAQGPRARLVGVACQAAELSASMHSDGARELYCFVGWLSVGSMGGPDLTTFRRSYRRWAGVVYEQYMRPVWTASMSAVRQADPGRPGPPPWTAAVQHEPPLPVPQATVIVPPEDWAALWARAVAGPTPVTVVLGWKSAERAHRTGVTHLGTGDLLALRPVLDASSSEPITVPGGGSGHWPIPPGPVPPPVPGVAVETGPPVGRPVGEPFPPPPQAAWAPALRNPVLLAGAATLALLCGIVGAVIGRASAGTPSAAGSTPPVSKPTEPSVLQVGLTAGGGLTVPDGSDGQVGLHYDRKILSVDKGTTAVLLPAGTQSSFTACAAKLRASPPASPVTKQVVAPGLIICMRTNTSGWIVSVAVTKVSKNNRADVIVTTWKGR
jgi:hypothetical protein